MIWSEADYVTQGELKPRLSNYAVLNAGVSQLDFSDIFEYFRLVSKVVSKFYCKIEGLALFTG